MTIREYIIEKELTIAMERLEKLEAMDAPSIMVNGIKKEIEKLENGIIEVGGTPELLDFEFTSRDVKQGNGGKVYIQFDGIVNYFPKAKYGRFIAVAQ